MDGGKAHQVVETLLGLQIAELHVAQAFGQLSEAAELGPVAADHEGQVATALEQSRRFDHHFDALLVGDVS